MTKHKATFEQWSQVERYEASCFRPCLLELRDRVEALEAAQRPTVTVKDSLTVPADSLVGRVADAIYSNLTSGHREEACAAILATANWLDQQELHDAATRLRMEVG